MVFLHLKRVEESVLLTECAASTSTDEVAAELVFLHNARLRLERLCLAIEDLAKHGVAKPLAEQGYSQEEITAAAATSSDSNAVECVPTVEDPASVAKGDTRDPTGRRCGKAPSQEYARVLTDAATNTREITSNKRALRKAVTVRKDYENALDTLRGAVAIAYPMGLPEYDPVREIIDGTEDPLDSIHAREHFEAVDEVAVWWAGREILRGRVLSDYVGKNDKTTIVVKLAKRGQGAPSREPPLDDLGRKNLMSYYYKRQETEKKLAEADADAEADCRSSTEAIWANPRALKDSLHGLPNNVHWRPSAGSMSKQA